MNKDLKAFLSCVVLFILLACGTQWINNRKAKAKIVKPDDKYYLVIADSPNVPSAYADVEYIRNDTAFINWHIEPSMRSYQIQIDTTNKIYVYDGDKFVGTVIDTAVKPLLNLILQDIH